MNAFEALASCRSYEAWMLLRPALEATLIIGKWVDNPENAALWRARETRKKEYSATYSGKGMISSSLPRSAEIRSVLGRLNDEFVHTNVAYYSRHTNAVPLPGGDIFLRLEFFDEGEDTDAHACAFLHLLAVLTDSLDQLFAVTLPSTGAARPVLPALENEIGKRAAALRGSNTVHVATLVELGLWREDHVPVSTSDSHAPNPPVIAPPNSSEVPFGEVKAAAVEMRENQRWNQLANAISARSNEDSSVWEAFGTFWASNAILLVALFANGDLPKLPFIAPTVSGAGTLMAVVWYVVLRRGLLHIDRFDALIKRLESDLRLPDDQRISAMLTEDSRRGFLKPVRSREIMRWASLAAGASWLAATIAFVF